MNPGHEIFAKDYVAPKEAQRVDGVIEVPNLDELQGFMANLPLSKNKAGRRTINLLDPATKQRIKIQKLEAKVRKAAKAVEDAKKKQEEAAAERAAKQQAKA